MLNADSPEIKEFLSTWHKLHRDDFELRYPNLDYDANSPISAHTRENYVEIVMLDDHGRSYKFLVDRLTHEWIKEHEGGEVMCINRTYSAVGWNIHSLIVNDVRGRGCKIESSTAECRSKLEWQRREFDPEYLCGRRCPPTPREDAALQQAYEVFNQELFEGKLPAVDFVLLYQSSSVYVDEFTYGYFREGRFSGREGFVGTIVLNRNPIISEGVVLTTLVHEMVHAWQFAFDRPRPGHHNRDWGDKMRSVGLDPEALKTGEHMRLHALGGGDGPFTLACRKLRQGGLRFKWKSCSRCRRSSYLRGNGVSLCAACERICAARETQLPLNFTDIL